MGDVLCPGLYLRASTKGIKSWSVVFRTGERVQRVTLGRYPILTLAVARQRALQLLRELAAGGPIVDVAMDGAPLADLPAGLAEEPAATLGDLIESYVAHISVRARSWKLIASSLRRPEMRALRGRVATTVTKRELVAVVDKMATAGAPHAATSLLRHLKTALNFAVERDMLATNPLDKVRPPAKVTERDRILSDVELGKVWAAIGELPQPWRSMIRLMVLTGQRRCEVSNMAWHEVDIANATWVIPRERVKKDRPHFVPLTPVALAAIKALHSANAAGFVFSNDGGVRAASNFHKTKRLIDQKCGVQGWVLHDLRRTVRSGLAALGVPRDVARAVVNHAEGKIDRVYNRYEYAAEKREALEKWERHLVSRSAM